MVTPLVYIFGVAVAVGMLLALLLASWLRGAEGAPRFDDKREKGRT
jgi:hypothetical protein